MDQDREKSSEIDQDRLRKCGLVVDGGWSRVVGGGGGV